MRRVIGLALGASLGLVAMLAAAPAVADADIFAVSDVAAPSPRTDTDIALVNLNTGDRVALPAAVNTTANEQHPSITSDGNRMVFLRNPGTTEHVMLVDLATGETSNVFTDAQVAQDPPLDPSITADGGVVFTGGSFTQISSHFSEQLISTDVRSFPSEPYAHGRNANNRVDSDPGFIVDPVGQGTAADALIAFGTTSAGVDSIVLLQQFGRSPAPVSNPTAQFEHPALGTPLVSAFAANVVAARSPTVLFERRSTARGSSSDLVSRPASVAAFQGAPTPLLPVNTGSDETRPAFTPDSRYVVFARAGSDGNDRLFAWDTQTQTLVNSTGANIGKSLPATRDAGNVSAYMRTVFTFTNISRSGLVGFNLLQPSGVGIIVERVVGEHRLFGRRVPTLETVGRVPFGRFRKGQGRVRWNLRVHGKRLRRGTYQVTPRALTAKGRVRDLGRARIIRVRR